jgi:hypothetical protein
MISDKVGGGGGLVDLHMCQLFYNTRVYYSWREAGGGVGAGSRRYKTERMQPTV